MDEQQVEMTRIASVLIGNMTIASLIQDCIDALIEAYTLDNELFEADKEIVEEQLGTVINPFGTYEQTVLKEQAGEIIHDGATS